jgi:putative membrane-bound dehydrogenase-like protein
MLRAADDAPNSPLAPEAAQKLFQLPAELRIELAAAEPQVIDPVAIRFDERGRMWVAEMRDYPLGPPPGGDQKSRIRVLEDRDGDGCFETSTIFADDLSFVTGMQPWKGGVFVTRSGNVSYMKDNDGDGRADESEIWFEGFTEQNTQLRANHPRLALDNHIYIANGLRGGKVVCRHAGETAPIDISGMDFRFDPLTGKGEAVSGNGQFGLCFDDWGNRFVCSNRNPCRRVVLEDRYLKLNPTAAIPAVVSDVAAFGEQSRIYAISRAWTTSNLHAGQFTAACGVFVYRGNLLPHEFRGSIFTCDPTGNLVHREIVESGGVSLHSRPAYREKEFLASPDEWFRPVNMELGPDGALYVVDMYRCVIEHPDFVPAELKHRPDQRLGDDRGRIWRIVPKDSGKLPPLPNLAKSSDRELVKLLGDSNGWQRDTAQRLLLERDAKAVQSDILQLAEMGKLPQGRIHALWLLQGLHELTPPDVIAALQGENSSVRRHAILLAEAMSLGADPQVRAAIAYSIRQADLPALQAQALLTAGKLGLMQELLPENLEIARADFSDEWLRRAWQLAAGRDPATVLIKLLGELPQRPAVNDGQLAFIREVAYQAAVGKDDAGVLELLNIALGKQYEAAKLQPAALVLLEGLGRGFARRKQSLPEFVQKQTDEAVARRLQTIVDRLSTDAESNATEESQLATIDLLAVLAPNSNRLAMLALSPGKQTLRQHAIAALAATKAEFDWHKLLAQFPRETPAIRRAILDAVLRDAGRTSLLLDELQAARIKPAELDLVQSNRLQQHRDAKIKARALQIFGSATPADRVQALASYQPALQRDGNATAGRLIFEKNCSTCHRIGGVGVNVAPDISDSRTKTTAQLLGDILQPNRAIDSNYVAYSLLTTDGNAVTGILTLETAGAITLKQPGDKSITIPRDEIDELKSSGVSLMPEGLEKNIPLADMSDLLAFIKGWRYLDGKTPLGK